jgi:plasmid stability protein
MSSDAVRSTLYLQPALHQALRLKAATAHRSMSEIVNDALRAALREDEEDLAAFAARERERSINYEALLAQLKAELCPTVSPRASAEALVERWRHLPQVDPTAFRADVDSTVDCSL